MKKSYIIPLLIILVPIVLLLICSWNKTHNVSNWTEGFENKVRKANTLLKDWKNLRFFKPKNVDDKQNVATAPVHQDEPNSIHARAEVTPDTGVPFQVETFGNGNDNWRNLRFFHDQNVRPYLVATDPIHAKTSLTPVEPTSIKSEETFGDVVESFSLKGMFSKPNSSMKIDDPLIPSGDNVSKQLRGQPPSSIVTNTLSNGMPTGTPQSNLEAQYLNNLNSTNSTNQDLNKMLSGPSVKKEVPMINAKPQAMVAQEMEKSDFQKKFQCQFFSDKCPDGYVENGSFSVSGASMTCGDAVSTKQCKAVAEVRDAKLKKIHITDSGSGYYLDSPPVVKIVSRNGRGSGASAECVVDDEGRIQYINVTNSGSGYIETPLIEVSDPNSSRSCHLCCR